MYAPDFLRRPTLEALVALREVPLPAALAVPISAAILILQPRGAVRVEELGTNPGAILPGAGPRAFEHS